MAKRLCVLRYSVWLPPPPFRERETADQDIFSTFGPWQGITSEQIQFAQAVLNNATTTFGTAAYYNEDYGLEKSWQQSFFGANYERLLQIKDQVDPNRVFNCRQCVGSEGGF